MHLLWFRLYFDRSLEWDQNKNRKQSEKKLVKVDGRETQQREENVARISQSVSTSVLVRISNACSVEEMTGQKHYKLGAKSKWNDHADWPSVSGDELPRLLLHRRETNHSGGSRRHKQLKDSGLKIPIVESNRNLTGLYEALEEVDERI